MVSEVITVDHDKRVLLLDRLTMVAPLGLRFHDAITGEAVGDGLSVWAYPVGRPQASRPLFLNRRGVYVLHDAPGLRELRNGAGDDDYWNNLPPKKDFVIEVTDSRSLYLPFQFTASIPARGIYEWDGSISNSPPAAAKSIPLYSSPSRGTAAGLAAVRADLWDPTQVAQGAPAASAVLELYDDDRFIARGIADQQGRVLVLFPYPAPKTFAPSSPPGSPLGSPPRATGPALTDQVWTFRARALYAIQSPPQISTDNSLPDLRAVLSQPEATLWADETQTEELFEVAVQFGQPLILKSRPPSMSPPVKGGSMLFITPAV
jgi:hypothetical protein